MKRFSLLLAVTGLAAFAAPPASAAELPQTATINEQILAGYKAADIKKPAAKSTDDEFCRRIFIDLIGRIPTMEEAIDFQQDRTADKRSKLVNRLLNEKSYVPTVNGRKVKLPILSGKDYSDYATQHAEHWANQWTVWLITRSAHRLYRTQLSTWLTDKFYENTPYNQIVKELITATGESNKNAAVNFIGHHMGDPVPNDRRNELGSNDNVPITSRVTKLFLGLQTQCTQCHDHPFNKEWIQSDFWGVNAFFRQTTRNRAPTSTIGGNAQMMANPVTFSLSDNPEVNKEMKVYYERRDGRLLGTKPNFLKNYKDAEEGNVSIKRLPSEMGTKTRREVLADYVLAHDNFGRAYVNRVWGHLFGRGLHKDPTIDDFGGHNEIVHPELMAKLADEFKKYNYNTKALIEWICNSDAYQLSHVATKEYADQKYDPYFARMPLKAMSPEVLYESLVTATRAEPAPTSPGATAVANRRQGREDWLGKLVRNFGDDEGNELTFNGTVVQALLMMNGREMNDAITKKGENIVEDIVKKHTRGNLVNVNAIVDELFQMTVSRPATRAEQFAIADIQNGIIVKSRDKPEEPSSPGGTKPPVQRPPFGRPMPIQGQVIPAVAKNDVQFYQDLFWALLNTNEFMLNH